MELLHKFYDNVEPQYIKGVSGLKLAQLERLAISFDAKDQLKLVPEVDNVKKPQEVQSKNATLQVHQ